jgi:hypothetical protein
VFAIPRPPSRVPHSPELARLCFLARAAALQLPIFSPFYQSWFKCRNEFHMPSSRATSKPSNNKVSGKVRGRIVNNMQNGGLGCSPSPARPRSRDSKVFSSAADPRDSDNESSCPAWLTCRTRTKNHPVRDSYPKSI